MLYSRFYSTSNLGGHPSFLASLGKFVDNDEGIPCSGVLDSGAAHFVIMQGLLTDRGNGSPFIVFRVGGSAAQPQCQLGGKDYACSRITGKEC